MRILLVGDILNGHSGSPKILKYIARALQKERVEVKLIFFGETKDSSNIKQELNGLDCVIWKNKILHLLESPLRFYINKTHTSFKEEDVTSILGQFNLWRWIRGMGFQPDNVIYLNLWSSFGSLIAPTNKKNAVFLHETPLFEDFNPIVKFILRLSLRILMKKLTTLSTTERVRESTQNLYGLPVQLASVLHFDDFQPIRKEDFVLLDSRWSYERDPYFVIDLAKELGNYPIVMHGFFPDRAIEMDLKMKVQEKKLNVKIIGGLTETELSNLYDMAKVIVRWHANVEEGPSASVIQGISHNCIPVVTRNLGSAEVIGENISNEIVVEKDAKEIASVVSKLLTEDVLYSEVLKRLIEYKRKNSWTTFSKELISKLGDDND